MAVIYNLPLYLSLYSTSKQILIFYPGMLPPNILSKFAQKLQQMQTKKQAQTTHTNEKQDSLSLAVQEIKEVKGKEKWNPIQLEDQVQMKEKGMEERSELPSLASFFKQNDLKPIPVQNSRKKPPSSPPSSPSTAPYLYIINNLLTLSLPYPQSPPILYLYLHQSCTQHSLSLPQTLTTFGIEYLLAKFYITHDMGCPFSDRYKLAQLENMVPRLVGELGLEDWDLVWGIARGVVRRFVRNCGGFCQGWLFNVLRKWRGQFRNAGMDVNRLFETAKHRNNPEHKPSPTELTSYLLTKIKPLPNNQSLSQYLSSLKHPIQLEQPNEQTRAESTEKEGVSFERLKYYQRFRFGEGYGGVDRERERERGKEIYAIEGEDDGQGNQFNAGVARGSNRASSDLVDESDGELSQFQTQLQSDSLDLSKKSSNKSERMAQKKKRKSQAAKKTTTNITPSRRTPTPKPEKKKHKLPSSLNVPEIMNSLTTRIYEFHMRKPNFTMRDIDAQIQKGLREAKVPVQMQWELRNLWISQYKS